MAAKKSYRITHAKIGNQYGFRLPRTFFQDYIVMSLFLDFLMKDAMKNPSKLVLYTKEMSDEMDGLLADVIVDS